MTFDIRSRRLLNQQLVNSHFSRPADVVRWFGAIQSQDLPASLWAVGLRLKKSFTESEVEHAIAEKAIVRSWPMRGTIHFMPAEDAKWMTRLLGPRLDAKAASNYRRARLTPDTIKQAGDVIAAALQGNKQCTRAELYAALEHANIPTSGYNGEQRGMHLIVHWARHGLICIAPRRGKQQTFALLDEWLPGGNNLKGDEAKAELARRYFQSHGPATVKDFAWWTGLTITEARQIVEQLKAELLSETTDGTQYWFTANQSVAGPHAILLPPFDEYTIAYKDRSAVITRDQLKAAGYGIAPNLIIDGRIAGTWKRTQQKQTVILTVQLLQPLTATQKTLAAEAAERYARFLGLKLKLQIVSTRNHESI